MTGVPTATVREGRASILVPDVPRLKGPGRRTALPFYNPAMAVCRDVTVSVLSSWLPKGASILDGLAATGVFGIRASIETEKQPVIAWNDKNPRAQALIEENARRNGVVGEVLREDLRAVLSTRQFTYVDIDPFGPPVPFVDAAIQQSWRGSAIGITATDVAPLAGTYPSTCCRRYGARSMRTPCASETALRIFIGYLVRVAAMHERGLRPLAAFAAEHFLRAIVAVDPRARAADEGLAQLGFARFEGPRVEVSPLPPTGPHAGSLWLGPLADTSVLAAISAKPEIPYAASHLLALLREEADLPPFFLDNHELARATGVDPVPVLTFIAALRTAGFRATRTHFTANGVRTNAPWEDLTRLYRDSAKP